MICLFEYMQKVYTENIHIQKKINKQLIDSVTDCCSVASKVTGSRCTYNKNMIWTDM